MKEEKIEQYKTIHLNEVKRMLGFKGEGYRSVLSWCKKKKIAVFGESNRRRILQSDWVTLQQKEFVKALRILHPQNWREILADRGIPDPTPLDDIQDQDYEPKSDLAKNFLKG